MKKNPGRYPEAAEVNRQELSVREARACFSEVVRSASSGKPVTITLHGNPVAMVTRPSEGKPFKVNWELLRRRRPRKTDLQAEAIIREDRDARG